MSLFIELWKREDIKDEFFWVRVLEEEPAHCMIFLARRATFLSSLLNASLSQHPVPPLPLLIHTHTCHWQSLRWSSASLLPQRSLLGCQTLMSLCNTNCDVRAPHLPSYLVDFPALCCALNTKSIANKILEQKDIFHAVYLYDYVNYLSTNP